MQLGFAIVPSLPIQLLEGGFSISLRFSSFHWMQSSAVSGHLDLHWHARSVNATVGILAIYIKGPSSTWKSRL